MLIDNKKLALSRAETNTTKVVVFLLWFHHANNQPHPILIQILP